MRTYLEVIRVAVGLSTRLIKYDCKNRTSFCFCSWNSNSNDNNNYNS